MVRVSSNKNFLSGLLFLGCGGFGLFAARDYAVGTAFRMGPGYFPMIVGGVLVLLGGWLVVLGLTVQGSPAERIVLRPLLLTLGSVVLFALLIRPFGIVVATLAMTVVARLGGWDYRPVEIVALSVVLAAGCALIFVLGLGLPFKVWPR